MSVCKWQTRDWYCRRDDKSSQSDPRPRKKWRRSWWSWSLSWLWANKTKLWENSLSGDKQWINDNMLTTYYYKGRRLSSSLHDWDTNELQTKLKVAGIHFSLEWLDDWNRFSVSLRFECASSVTESELLTFDFPPWWPAIGRSVTALVIWRIKINREKTCVKKQLGGLLTAQRLIA